eukprot:3557736-Prorocentrum_lima.AAC.1
MVEDDGEQQEAQPLPDEPQAAEELTEEVPDREQQAMLLRVHKNLGHPKLNDFLRALRVGGVRPSIRLW